MKKLTEIAAILISVCALSLFNVNCESGHDHDDHEHGEESEGHDHDKNEEHAKGDKEGTASSGAGDNYPLKVCVVSDEELGSMGDPIVIKHDGTTVKFCCDGCIDDFNEEPEKYLAKLAAASKGS